MTTSSPDPSAAEFVFETATATDIEALVAIDQSSPVPWPARDFAEEIHRHPPTLFVLRARDHVVAFVVARIHPPELDIVNVAVDLARRRQGFGQRIVEGLLTHSASEGARTAFLEVRESNEPARRLYRSLGFHETQKRPAFYRDPVESAVLMSRSVVA